MNTDRYTKALLTLIALGLWMNVAISMFQPAAVAAQDQNIGIYLSNIQNDLHRLEIGACPNMKMCQ